MNYFLTTQSPLEGFSVLVFPTGTERPHEHLPELALEFRRQRIKGRVVFDLLMANGARSARFFAVNFDGAEFDRFVPMEPLPELRRESSRFYAEHFEEFDTALLSPAVRFALQRGISFGA